ncbi:hypothetical protein BCF74_1037 [Knoellia remsis]|uniref:Uncharacterized protein n=1 Tax=Knoellia remsis TaxID=407159 RepID=A0A2T0UY04_9MICO|nr:hypothetical protein [Knoellia remsis]PRY62801.1 hypothetical protein BCF74_1037 [Knoellia remsis]
MGQPPRDQFEWRDQYRFPSTVTDAKSGKTHTCTSEDLLTSNGPTATWYTHCKLFGRSWGEANAQRSQSLSRIADQIVISRPLTTTRQEVTESGRLVDNYVRDSAQDLSQRWTMGLTDLASARRFGLDVAQLAAPSKDGSATFAAPSPVSMAAAVSTMTQDKATGLLKQDYSSMVAGAYPGTMLQYLALPTSGLDKELATKYADFVRYATTTGQTPGTAPGTLPEGYVPLPAAFRAQAAKVADAVQAQKGAVPVVPVDPKNPDTPSTGGGGGAGPGGGGTLPGGTTPGGGAGSPAAAAGTPAAAVAAPAGTTPSAAPKGRTVAMPESLGTTRGEKGGWTKWVFPGVLLTGLLAGVGIPFGLVTGQPGHPVRVVGSQLLRDVGHVLRIRRT